LVFQRRGKHKETASFSYWARPILNTVNPDIHMLSAQSHRQVSLHPFLSASLLSRRPSLLERPEQQEHAARSREPTASPLPSVSGTILSLPLRPHLHLHLSFLFVGHAACSRRPCRGASARCSTHCLSGFSRALGTIPFMVLPCSRGRV
jgi:hypothetical protein